MDALRQGRDRRIAWLLSSYRRCFGEALCDAPLLFDLPTVVLAHGTESPPLLFYGNRAALELWELPWERFAGMPSQDTAEPDQREGRARFLEEVERQGYHADYSGVRVSASGRRFEIQHARLWNILDPEGARRGLAACFRHHRWLDGP